ncbi:MAG: acyl carrier protein [Planctomycetes bacterium]|nr:acyl carrier protein [Planctomycetota bacterium]
MTVPLSTPLPTLPDDPAEVERFIVWRLRRMQRGAGGEITPDSTFANLGVDSLQAITLIGELEFSLGRILEPELMFDCPTPRALAQRLVDLKRRCP